MVRCKFTCITVTKRKGWDSFEFVYEAEFQAVSKRDTAKTREDAIENEQFWAATPSGMLKVATIRADHFEVGKDYYLDMSLVG